MRRSLGWMLVLAVGLAAPARGQSLLEGPLSASDAAPAHVPKAPPKPTSKKPRAAKTTTPALPTREAAGATPTPSSGKAPADPLSFGMKWNGSNDNATQTRVQNYGGSAEGTGAEVGMKLHF